MKRPPHMTMQVLTVVAVFFCTVQALYWPLIPKPGTEYGWWQLKWAAQAGYVLGAPVLALATVSPFEGAAQNVFVVLLALLWALLLCFLVNVVARWIVGVFRR
jgi:hypothetical protein